MKLELKAKTTKTGHTYYAISYGPVSVAITPAFARDKDGNINRQEWAKFFSLVELYTASEDNKDR